MMSIPLFFFRLGRNRPYKNVAAVSFFFTRPFSRNCGKQSRYFTMSFLMILADKWRMLEYYCTTEPTELIG